MKTSNCNRTNILGMNLSELSLGDICEEITDCKRDLAVIDDYEKGHITFGELIYYTSFRPNDKQKLIDAITELKKIKKNKK